MNDYEIEQQERADAESARIALQLDKRWEGCREPEGKFAVRNFDKFEAGEVNFFGPFDSEDEAYDFIRDASTHRDDMDVISAAEAISILESEDEEE